MPVGVLQETPGGTAEMYDAVAVKLDAMAGGSRRENPPEGVIFHAAGFSEGDMVVFDVWESREAWEKFESDRLVPAIRSVRRRRE